MMEARELVCQVFCTILSFLYINGDSEYSLNSDSSFDYFPPEIPQQNPIIYKKPDSQYNFSHLIGQSWPFIPGAGLNTNVLIPPISPVMIPGGGMVEGFIKGLPGPGFAPLITKGTGKRLSAEQLLSVSDKSSAITGGWKGGSWKGFAPLQPGAAPFIGGKSLPQIPPYGYKESPVPQIPQLQPIPGTSMSLPIPAPFPALLKRTTVPADPIHGLPMNYLYAQIPLIPSDDGVINVATQINPLTSDIIIVIDGSEKFGEIDATGKIFWNPLVAEFLIQFISQVTLGPKGNRVGVVIVSFGIDDMIALTHDKNFLLQSLNNLRPTFTGGCTGKGIATASNLFFQYGRPTAVKRVVHLTDGSPLCSYSSMHEGKYARKCGIDIVNVVIGKTVRPPLDQLSVQSQWLLTGKESFQIIWQSLLKRMFLTPVHGGWSVWSAWNHCSMLKSCDIGYQQRFRVCDNPRPMYGGVSCPGYSIETRMCYPNLCIDVTIGHWTTWTDWTACSVLCGIGSQTRSRNCLTLAGQPSPTCRGKYMEIRDCMVKSCPVHGEWSLWSEWGLCSALCGAGVKMRVRHCDTPSPKFGGKACEGIPIEETICDTGKPCPIHGGFGPWSSFRGCSVLCGVGEQIRTRECNSPVPQFGGHPCEGPFIDKKVCDTGQPCPINGGWSIWGEYSLCSAKCGTGLQRRERLCNSPVPQFGGRPCQGPAIEETICDTGIKCPIDGQWSLWTQFSPCFASCGSGITRRTRTCTNPSPMFGGMDCIGVSVEEQECETGLPCPVDGGWSLWSVWSTCLVKCGTGIIFRRRECNNPEPKYGGKLCIGMNIEETICDTKVSCPVNGQWSVWMAWSYCSASCGKGTRQRHRLCNNPAPNFGGISCEGFPIQEEVCDTSISCPVAGGWSPWVVVEDCNVKCGQGLGKRVRECNNPSPKYGGPDCIGPNKEIFNCDTGVPCPIHGEWGVWSMWSKCAITCGIGFTYRRRKCDSPFPQYGGLPCQGSEMEEKPCDKGLPCPVDGHWSFWSSWTVCSAKCGKGVLTRKRVCNNPAPMFGGLPCAGPDVETIPCDSGIPCPIHGGWSEWSALSACSVTCGAGVMIKTRVCDSPHPEFGGLPCEGINIHEMVCDTGVHCPIHGQWGRWSQFSICSVTCGIGSIERKRFCDSPAPDYGGEICVGESVQIRSCNTGVFCPIPGGWSVWSPFTSCSKMCGIGVKKRTRTCTNPIPQYEGPECIGLGVEEKPCDTGINCPVDGRWSSWGEWGQCSVVCGIGYQQRARLCNNPTPMYGGGNCLGSPIEERQCNTGKLCPVDGGWGKWSEYSACSVKCGVGIQIRIRKCDSPFPQYGGQACVGQAEENIPCDTGKPCPVNGQWTAWLAWEACSVVCGIGFTRRFRECSNPPPMYGGLPCAGKGIEEKPCDTGINCPIHGSWSTWGKYSICTAKCGTGVTHRYRACDNPSPMYGGDICIGGNVETKPCETGIPCPINGGFSEWSWWSECSATCGKGTRARSRLCNSPAPLHGGADCAGALMEEEICLADVYCPVDGFWSFWSAWSECSVPCGLGVQERDRVCNNPAPLYGGRPCEGKRVDVVPCDTGVHCPVDGGWSIWTVWSDCSAPCGVDIACEVKVPSQTSKQTLSTRHRRGTHSRTRTCTHPAPEFGGKPCSGINDQEQLCNTGIYCPQHGNWGLWSEWGQCKAKCGTGNYTRFRLCDNPPPLYGGRTCEGVEVEQLSCDSGIPCPVNGIWSSWEQWSFCSVTCGTGKQQRRRACSNPTPKYGGYDCKGQSEQFQDCDTGAPCPIDGNWSSWGKYSLCSVSCGIGTQLRTRHCTSPAPQNGGLFCKGPDAEISSCNTGMICPIHGNWGHWSIYSECSVKCGTGIQTRTRTCSNPPPQYGGELCFGNNAEDILCDTGINCPVDGSWSNWGDWSFCSATCGYGMQMRIRFCTNPAPLYGGGDCQGLANETLECDSGIPCPVHGGWNEWYDSSVCSVSCGVGLQERRRKCTNPEPQFGGKTCIGIDVTIIDCDTGNICSVDGQWSGWSEWNICSASCGIGLKQRQRECTSPPPQNGGLECVGAWEETAECDTGIYCPVDGQWSLWGQWGLCSAKCGKGTYRRFRECSEPEPKYGGADCIGPVLEVDTCDTLIPCPVHGGWSFWSNWSFCSVDCGVGEKFRTRTCTNPSPLYGGFQCKGPAKETVECNTGVYCPVNGNWGLWSAFSMCEGRCGMGLQHRYRMCDSPSPKYGGSSCTGYDKEIVECKIGLPCPVDGGWSFWSTWSICLGKCGVGTRERTRICENPSPQYGGADCFGPTIETEPCDTDSPCAINGNWGSWMEWSKCSGECGTGVTTRVRHCDSPKPQYGGFDCVGVSEEVLVCDLNILCPVDGGWTIWTKWSECEGKCGRGLQKRIRDCTNPMPKYGGQPCKGPAEEFLECDTLAPCPIDGHWSLWSSYTPCSVTCGFGTQTRSRTCSEPAPQFGGLQCEGTSEQSVGCDTKITCAVDGNWNSWYAWSSCSVTCGMGEKQRRRQCNNPPPSFGGKDCIGTGFEIVQCETGILCEVHGNWAFWSSWSVCIGYCGIGFQIRTRECSNPAHAYGGKPCFGNEKESLECDTGIPCAVDGNWGQWSKFSKCSVDCGVGFIQRTRQCDSPAPQFGGLDCNGPSFEEQKCDTLTPCVVHGGWSFWGDWSICSTTCGYGLRTRIRTCSNPSPLYGGLMCTGQSEETVECDIGMKCPIHGQWSSWYEWSVCNAKCGYGTRKRRRECTSPKPQYGGLPCDGPLFEVVDCFTGTHCPIDGQWSAWGSYGKCSVTCGVGIKERIRFCDNPLPQNGGQQCVGPAKDISECNSGFNCVIAGGWSQWGEYTHCSATCGMGFKTRERACNSPKPQFGGNDCIGPSFENVECDSGIPCPVDGGFTFWSAWSLCSASCGFGVQIRRRTCTNPVPMYGGRLCVGPLEEYIDCNAGRLCPLHGHWSAWSEWKVCNAKCGIGRQIRFRTCSNPKPQNGGQLCEGYPEEWKECDTGKPCPIDGGWSYWGRWSTCQGSCDVGLQFRKRLCTEPAPKYGGADCKGNNEESKPCDTGVPCMVVVDGHWSAWSFWTKCSASCGEGIESRRRFCDNPAPMNGGFECIGYAEERRTCFSGTKCGIDGEWSLWGIWSRCSSSCGEGIQIRMRYCNNPSPVNGGKDCAGYAEEQRTCLSDKQCGIDGGWSLWGIWSTCSASCGDGVQKRMRYCNNPSPMYMLGGKDCKGPVEEARTCFSDKHCSTNGAWSMWGFWSTCSVSCGDGVKIRSRSCNNPSPIYGGRDCQGIAEERIVCQGDALCEVDGGWSWWTKWSACTSTCGNGVRERRRFCDSPVPQYGGKPCSGKDLEQAPCLDNPACPDVGLWSDWLSWQRCDCNTGMQERIRICTGLTGCIGEAKMEKSCDPLWIINNCPQGEWQMWSLWSSCTGSCGQGVRERIRDCIDKNTGAISTACKGLHTEISPCHLQPCLSAEWELWSTWTSCSTTCGEGIRERTRVCIDTISGRERKDCKGLSTELVTCETLPCPTLELNCSTECKWDNGIGYAVYPGDCSMFVQCDSLYGHPLVQQCPWGLLWSLDALQCTFPYMSECDKCSKIREGEKRSYYITCRSYWTCPNGVPIPHCCKRGYRFDHHLKECVIDSAGVCNDDCPPVEKSVESTCTFRQSSLGSQWYEQEIDRVWVPRPCPAGTVFINEMCQCAYQGSDGTLPAMPDCLPELHLTFNSLAQDLKRNDGIQVVNVKYLGDGTAYFDGTAVINSNIFANAEWGRTVYVYIRFKPEGSGRRQGLIHNSGCGPSDIGPSVFIGLDRVANGLDMKFSAVPQVQGLKYEFVNITSPDNKMIDAWFKFGSGQFKAEVNGMTAVLDVPGASISRRHGALNIGGNLCRIGNEAFGGFIGILDEVKIYKCKPPL